MPQRFSAEINRLRAVLRAKHDSELIAALRGELEQAGTAALAVDNSTCHIAANTRARQLAGLCNAELLKMTVMGATPLPHLEDAGRLARPADRGSQSERRAGDTVSR